jgi:ferredoxin-nitrite reductase
VILRPEEANEVADAVLRVFIEHGDRTNRAKARLKYLLDVGGFPRFIEALEEKLGRKTIRIDPAFVAPRPATDRFAHIGRHQQKQPGLNWIGVALPVGKMTADEMRALGSIARDCGDGDIRLTVWQNLLLSGVADAKVPAAIASIECCGLSADASFLRAGLVVAPANAVANSRSPTPKPMRWRSPTTSRPASLSTRRSTFI